MFKSMLYRLLFVVCLWLHTVFLHCCARDVDKQQNGQTKRRQCLRNCFYQTITQINRTQLKSKITSRQSCYEECLRTFRKQDFLGNRQIKLSLKRIKRGNTAACEDAGDGKYRAVDKKNITVTFHKLGKTDRFYAKISWTPPPESVNCNGYKLIYITGKRRWNYNCKELNKTSMSYIVDNSSNGLGENDYFRVKVLSLPQIDGDYVDYMRKKVRLTIKPTDNITPLITDAETQGTTSSSPNAETQGTTSSSPSSPMPSSISDKETHFVTSPFSDNKTSQKKVIIPIVSVSIAVVVAVVVYGYFHRSKKQKTTCLSCYWIDTQQRNKYNATLCDDTVNGCVGD